MKGLVVVICAPSQGGKDFIAQEVKKRLESFDDMETSYATSYKIREPRKDDKEYIVCVENESDIPVKKEDQISAVIYGTQKIVYDKKEIDDKINKGKIVFIASASPEIAKKVKAEFGDYSIAVFVKRQQVDSSIMIKEDLKRHGIFFDEASDQDVEESVKRVNKRLLEYESMKTEMEEFVANKESGADYIFKNWHTLIGGKWNDEIDEKAKNEFYSLCNFIWRVRLENAKNGAKWRSNSSFDLFGEEERTKNIFTMQDEWKKYIEEKRERV